MNTAIDLSLFRLTFDEEVLALDITENEFWSIYASSPVCEGDSRPGFLRGAPRSAIQSAGTFAGISKDLLASQVGKAETGELK